MNFKKARWQIVLFGIVVGIAIIAAPARASMVSYFLDRNNAGLPDANYLKVTISGLTEADAIDFRVEVLVLDSAFPAPLGSNFGMDKFFFNFDDDTLDVGADNIDINGWTIKTNKNANGFGNYDFRLQGGGKNRTSLLTFSILGIVGDTPEDYAVGNEFGLFFAAHVADFGGSPDSAFFANSPVPIPASIWLFSSGIAGILVIRRKLKK